MKKTVLYLFGGRSGEHEVSIVSAKAVTSNTDESKYDKIEIGITKDGQWVDGDELESMKSGEDVNPNYEIFLSKKKTEGRPTIVKMDSTGTVWAKEFDIAFPVLHGTYGEDGTIQGLFEMHDVPYVGAEVTGSAVGIDKVIFKKVMTYEGIPNANFLYYYRSDFDIKKAEEEVKDLSFPLFVKPSNTGSSVGVVKVNDIEDFSSAMEEAFEFFDKVLVEEAVPNAREIEVSVLGNENNIEVSTPGEVFPGDEFYSYTDKYIDDKSYSTIPAELDEAKLDEIKHLAGHVYYAIDCKGFARVDFLMDSESGDLFINELNSIPGFTSISMYPKLWEHDEKGFKDLVSQLIELGFERDMQKSKNKTTYDSTLLEK